MGLFSWLLGGAPKLPTGRFCTGRYRLPGEWVQATMAVEVVGIPHKKPAAEAFVVAAKAAEEAGLRYGLSLVLDPGNQHDPNAIKVFGHAGEQEWHIGYVDRETAQELHHDLISKGIPVGVELYSIFRSADGFIDIKMIILGPPGHSEKSRRRRRERP